MGYNVGAFERLVKWLREDPHEFDLRHWATRRPECGTTYCIAGKAVTNAGWRMRWRPDLAPYSEAAIELEGERQYSVGTVAQEILGINADERKILFAEDDTSEIARSVSFLLHLNDRAKRGLPNMTADGVTDWDVAWVSSYDVAQQVPEWVALLDMAWTEENRPELLDQRG